MKKTVFVFLVLAFCCFSKQVFADGKASQDTVKIGVYIVGISDIDFRQKQYLIRFWVWMRYKNQKYDFSKNIEVPNCKSIEKISNIIDTSNNEVYTLMELKCYMKQSWMVHDYPFDEQHLELHIENAQYDTRDFIFVPDTGGVPYDPKLAISGWEITKSTVYTNLHFYETNFGDVTLTKPHSEYSAFNISFDIKRDAWGLFFKLFLGMYVAFLITFVCIFIHADNIDSRFALSVGALFAAVGNKYIIDSILPESSAFTLVDSLHAFTFISILITIALSVFSLHLLKKNRLDLSIKVDRYTARTMLVVFIILNIVFVGRAIIY